MSHCIEKIAHECGSSDGLQVFEDNGEYNGYCFACSTYVSDPYGDKPKGWKPPKPRQLTDEERASAIEEVVSLVATALPDRGLSKASLDHFGCRVGLSEIDGVSPTEVYFPYFAPDKGLSGFRVRLLAEKKMWSIGTTKDSQLFGWQQALSSGGKTLFITEGEYDAIALYQALKDKARGTKWADLEPAVVSLTSGAGSARRDITNNLTAIRANFKEVVLVFDQDDVGQAAVRQAVEVLPTARACGTLPAKDANECVLKGFSKGLVAAVLWKAEIPRNTHLVDLADYIEAGRVPPTWGLSWPWEGLTQLTRGIRFGETVYIGAGVKMGKSELVNSIATHFLMEHKMPVLMAKPEEANAKTMKMILGKIAGKIFHDPTIEWDEEMYRAYDEAATKVPRGHVLGINLYQHLGWESLRNEIMVAHQAGARVVFIDPISNLVNGMPSAEANTKLQEIAQELAALAKDLDIIVFIFCHLKAPDTGDSHERGGKVYSHQFAGSRAMMRSCNLMIGLEGNKDPDLDLYDRNTRTLVILEDREYGVTGTVKLYWDHHTSLFNEIHK